MKVKNILPVILLIMTSSCVTVPVSDTYKSKPTLDLSSYDRSKTYKVYVDNTEVENKVIKEAHIETVSKSLEKMDIPFKIVKNRKKSDIQIKIKTEAETSVAEGINAAAFLFTAGIIPMFGDETLNISVTRNGKTVKHSEDFNGAAGWIVLPFALFNRSTNYDENMLLSALNTAMAK